MGMFDGAKSVISGALAVGAVLLILAIIGVANQHVPMGMGAVGAGIGDIFRWVGEMLSHI